MTPAAAIADQRVEASIRQGRSLAVLETKLFTPKWRPGLVSRPRLVERLREGRDRHLVLISAPAGFGKTTLLAEWLGDETAGWVSLDRSENEPSLFWAYVIRALQKVQSGLGASALAMLLSTRQSPSDLVLTSLINEVSSIDRDFILVLDDYHVIDAPDIHAGVTFLLDHLPPRLQLVIASRSDPLLPVARLRARGQVTELRAEDLRFTPDEAASFLNEEMALELSGADVATLETRTEGWIAGLKLAALSLRNRGDVQKFIRAFAGDNRYIADYLIQEVLNTQPESVRRFLLGTAILDRLTGPLCDAVTGEPGSQTQLEALEKSNLFVVPLDDTRDCYRYHHLFAEVLRAHSVRTDPANVRSFHGRASSWFESNGSLDDALHHAAAADDAERVARLLETRWPSMDRSYQQARWLERVKALPDAIVRNRPVLSVAYVWALLNAGDLEAAEVRLGDVERLMSDSTDRTHWIVVDEARFRALRVEIDGARAYLAQARGDTSGTVEHTRRLLELIPESDLLPRITTTALLALAHWTRGELEEAHGTFTTALALMRSGGHVLDAIRGEFVPAEIRVGQGRLREAAEMYERSLRLANESSHPGIPETDELYLGLSELYLERGDVAGAERLMQTLTESAGHSEHAGNRERCCTVLARLAEVRGDVEEALRLLEAGERDERRTPVPRLRPIPAIRARIWITQRRLAEARGWAKEQRLSIDDEPSYMREFEHITLARLLIARYRVEQDDRAMRDALALLERLLMAASQGGRKGSAIEILVLEALAHEALSNTRAALDPLERALALGASEGFVRIFVDEGDTMRDLLRHAAARGAGGEYTRQLLRAFDGPVDEAAEPSVPTIAGTSPLVLALTPRELEILRLIAVGLRNQEIAGQLDISTATVKRHVANAYSKLDVSHRTEALARANALNLL